MRKMKKMKLKKRFVALLLALIMLAGIIPLSAISVDAYQVTTDRFEAAYNWALGYANRAESVGSGDYAALVGKALNANGFSGMNETGTDALYKNIEALASVEIFNTSSTDDLNNTDYFIVTNRVDFIAFWHNGTYVYNSGTSGYPKAQSTITWTSFNRAYRLKETKNIDESEDIGDNFCAYINVVGAANAQHSRTLSYHRNNKNVYATPPIYDDTTNQNNTRQIWKFRKHYINGVWDGYYLIENYASPGWYLNVQNGEIAYKTQTTNIVISDWINTHENDKSSLWQLVKNGDVSSRQCYYLKPKNNLNDNGSYVENPVALNIDTNGTGDDAHLYGDDVSNGSSRFYIYKINEVTDGLNAVINCVLNGDTRVAVNSSNNDVQFQTNADLTAGVSDQNQQVWIFERQNQDAYPPIYKIKNRRTGTYLQVDGTAPVQNNIKVGDDSDSNALKWILLGDDTNSLNFISLLDNTGTATDLNNSFRQNDNDNPYTYMSMDAPGSNTQNGTSIKTYSNNLAAPQRFILSRYWVDNGDFYSAIKSDLGSGYVLSLSMDGKNTVNDKKTNVVLRRYKYDVVDQTWYFRSMGDGTYVIQNLANGYFLDVPARNLKNGISAYNEYNGDDNQRWYIVQEPNGNYSICSKLDFNKTIDVPGAALTGDEQNNLQFWDNNQTKAQTWQLDFENKTSPAWGENLGDTFWAYISPSSASDRYLHCGDERNPSTHLIYCEQADDSEKKKQENYWKFERNADGSYKISSCNLVNTVLDGDNNVFGGDQGLSVYDSNNGYAQRWFFRKYNGGYQIESKLDGKVLTLQDNFSILAINPANADAKRLFNIIKTDLTVDSDMPNVKMHLFNYGNAINDITEVNSIYEGSSVLSFFQSAHDNINPKPDGSVDGMATKSDFDKYYDGDYIPLMSKKLGTDGFPLVDKYVNPNSTKSDKVESGSLKYLFDPEMGKNNNGFVQGSGSQTSYDTSAQTVSYQSQHFTVNNPTSLFKKNPKNGLYYYDSLLNAAYFRRDKDSSGKELTSGNFNLYDYTERRFHNNYTTGNDTTTGLNTTSGHFLPFNMGHISGNIDYDGGTRPTIATDNQATDNLYVTRGAFAPVDYKFEQSTNVDTWFGMSLECEFQQTSDGTYKGQDMIFQFKGDDDVWVYIDDVLVLDIGGTHSPREASVNFKTGAVTYPKRNASDGKVSGSEMVNTNLRALFESANVSTADFNNSGETNTFKSDSKHNLKFFILERGGSDSYFQLMFNLPKGTPSVTKEVNYSDPDFNDKRDYKFKIEKAIPTGNSDNPYTYQDFSGVTYLLESSDGTSVDGIPLAADGIFTLKAGQTAYFHNIDDGTKFRVTEFHDEGISKTIGQYTKNVFDTSGNKVTVTVDEDEVVQNNGNKTEYYVALDKNGDIVTAKDGKIVAVDEDGNVVKADDKGNKLYTVDGSTVAVDKDGYIVPADENGNKQLYDGSGTILTYPFQLKSWNDTNDRVMGPYELKTSVDQNIRFTNKLQTTGLRIKQEVYSRSSDGTQTKVDSVSGAVYNFSLRFFSKNNDGTTSECGQKDFSISGDKLSTVVMLDKLPAGVSYELWQYYPDDANHRYLSPTFVNSEGKTNGGKFVIQGETPGVDSGINGVLIVSSDDSYPNTITVKNIYVEGQQVVFGKTDNKQSVEVGETVTYTITSSIPDTTYFTGYTYKITDTMSNGLTFDADKGVTAVIRSNNSDITLKKDTDYTFSQVGNGFELNINIMNEKFKVYTNKNIVITYTAVVNNQAVAKISKNSAKLEYSINPADSTETVITDVYEEVVYSAKIVVVKHKAGDENQLLEDAEFRLYKLDGTAKKYYKNLNGVVSWVDKEGEATTASTTHTENDLKGKAFFGGVADGTYYLQEVKVPAGYNIPAKDTEVIVNGGGVYPDENKLAVIAKVPNNTSVKLPEAGGIGRTILFTVSATLAVTILIAAAIRFKRRRKTAFKPRYSK